MNIYLDIDGVLLTKNSKAADHVHLFLSYVVEHHTPYWLTTRCRGDAVKCVQLIEPYFEKETVSLLNQVRPTNWSTYKTEAIDFAQPFLWFDDNLFIGERKVLEQHSALDNWIEVDLNKRPDMLRELVYDFPIEATQAY